MAEYIDREEIKEWIAAWLKEYKYWHPYSKGKNIPTAVMFDMLTIIPAADVQPVKHGKWADEGFYADGSAKHAFHCSNCGHHIIEWKDDTSNYCPHCGAKMREET